MVQSQSIPLASPGSSVSEAGLRVRRNRDRYVRISPWTPRETSAVEFWGRCPSSRILPCSTSCCRLLDLYSSDGMCVGCNCEFVYGDPLELSVFVRVLQVSFSACLSFLVLFSVDL